MLFRSNIWKFLKNRASIVKAIIATSIGHQLLLATTADTRFEKLCIIVLIYHEAFIPNFKWEEKTDPLKCIPFPKAICKKIANQDKLLDIFYQITDLTSHKKLIIEEKDCFQKGNIDPLCQIPEEYWMETTKWTPQEKVRFGKMAVTRAALSEAVNNLHLQNQQHNPTE